jgi:hypothetical protein
VGLNSSSVAVDSEAQDVLPRVRPHPAKELGCSDMALHGTQLRWIAAMQNGVDQRIVECESKRPCCLMSSPPRLHRDSGQMLYAL